MKIRDIIETTGSTGPIPSSGSSDPTGTDGVVWPPEPGEDPRTPAGSRQGDVSPGYYGILNAIQSLSGQEAFELLKLIR